MIIFMIYGILSDKKKDRDSAQSNVVKKILFTLEKHKT